MTESRVDLSTHLVDPLAEWLGRARWFAGKGRAHTITNIRQIASLGTGPEVVVVLVDVDYGTDLETYQIPLAAYGEPVDRLAHAAVAVIDRWHLYDATHDRNAMAHFLIAFDRAAAPDATAESSASNDLAFHRVGSHQLDLETHSTLFSGEQSNSSVAFGEDALLKLFRKVTPGENPDIEIHRSLTESGSTHVAALLGWLRHGDLDLGMLQEFLTTATDGWELALASIRNLLADPELEPEQAGGDFAAEAHRLGTAVREVHDAMLAGFGASPIDASAICTAMQHRLASAAAEVPALQPHVSALRSIYRAAAEAGDAVGQRVHGDLHLGQTLRTVIGWKLVDFEGEPAKPLADRRLPDSPWRDVAGMLRSFDYAARSAAKDLPALADDDSDPVQRTGAWLERNRAAFLDGYLQDGSISAAEQALLDAYEADKAVYEAIYETRNRPGWLDIPLAGIAHLATRHPVGTDAQEDA